MLSSSPAQVHIEISSIRNMEGIHLNTLHCRSPWKQEALGNKDETDARGRRTGPRKHQLRSVHVEFIRTFNYLGSTLSNNGDLKPEINRQRTLATSVMQSLSRPLRWHRHISQKTKLRTYNACVMSVLLYGAETWALNAALNARINGFDTRALRRLEGIHWSQHN